MKFRKLEGSESITITDIEELNKTLRFSIDESYAKFILENNCVAPEFNFFMMGTNDFVFFRYFLGINKKNFLYDLYSAYINNKDRIPNDLFPIAKTGEEDILCMGYKGENKGKIFSCALGDVVNKVSYEDGTVFKVADSLDEVLSNLVEDPEV